MKLTRLQKLGSFNSAENPGLSKVLSSKPGLGQNVATHASPTARNVSLSDVFVPGSFSFFLFVCLLSLSLPVVACVSRFGLAVRRLAGERKSSVRFLFGSPFSSEGDACGHCLVTLSLTHNETLSLILAVTSFSDRRSLPLPPPPGLSVPASTSPETARR